MTDGERSSSEVPTSPVAPTVPDLPEQDGAKPDQARSSEIDKKFDEVINSDLGVEILLGRLKHCIAAHRDVATFAREMGSIADKQSKSAKKLVRELQDSIRTAEKKKGSYAMNFDSMLKVHDAAADYNQQFSLKCTQLWEELTEQAKVFEDRRRQEKQNGLAAEKRGQTAEDAMRKSKTKRDSLADDLDRVKTGDKATGRFGLKGPKSAAQQEEDLTRKLQAADQDYQQKTQNAAAVRRNLLQNDRPQTVHRLVGMIKEMDAQLGYELQIYVSYYESMILQTGQLLVPVNNAVGKRLAETMFSIDSDADLKNHVNSYAPKIGNTNRELIYEPHHTQAQTQRQNTGFAPPQQQPTGTFRQASGPAPSSFGQPQPQPQSRQFSGQISSPQDVQPQAGTSFSSQPPHLQTSDEFLSGGSMGMDAAFSPSGQIKQTPVSTTNSGPGQISSPVESGYQHGAPQGHGPPMGGPGPQYGHPRGQGSMGGSAGGPQLPGMGLTGMRRSSTDHQPPPGGPGMQGPPQQAQAWHPGASPSSGAGAPNGGRGTMPGGPMGGNGSGPMGAGSMGAGPMGAGPMGAGPMGAGPPGGASGPPAAAPSGAAATNPMFEVHLQALYDRDGPPVPVVVTQAIQAVEMFGVSSFGIYRVAGSATHIQRLRQMFDHDPKSVDLRSPETFFQDINAVAGLLKLFFRSLPDGGVLTAARYAEFIEAAKIEDGVTRRDSLHAIINGLPDTNYATLRALCLHLWKVQESSHVNNMTSANLAICFGPTILQPSNMRDVADAGWQVKAVETIFTNTTQIFDED